MAMTFIGLALGFTAFMVLMVQVGYETGFDRNHPTSGRIYRVDKTGKGKDDIFRTILPRGYADDIIACSPHIQAGTVTCPFIGELYRPEIKQEKIVSLFTLLAAILSLAGIFGQVLLDLQYSRRTIAIRKVYGAENAPLIWDCLKKYTLKLLVSFLIAVPLGWLAIVRWQEGFVEKVGISGLEFLAALAIISLLTLAIVALMSWRAVRTNPVDSLRKE